MNLYYLNQPRGELSRSVTLPHDSELSKPGTLSHDSDALEALRADKHDLETKYAESRLAILSIRAEACKLLSENKSLKLKCAHSPHAPLSGDASLKDKCVTLMSRGADLKDRCETLMAENAILKDKCVSLLADTDARHLEHAALKDKCVSLLAKASTLKADRQVLLAEACTLRAHRQELLEKCETYQSGMKSDTQRIQTLVDAMGGVHTLLDTLADTGVASKDLSDSRRLIKKIVAEVTRE